MPGPGDGDEAGPGLQRGQVSAKLAEGTLAASVGVGERADLALERRHLGAQLLVPGIDVGDDERQLLRRQAAEARIRRLAPKLGDHEDAEDRGHDGHRPALPRSRHDGGAAEASGRA